MTTSHDFVESAPARNGDRLQAILARAERFQTPAAEAPAPQDPPPARGRVTGWPYVLLAVLAGVALSFAVRLPWPRHDAAGAHPTPAMPEEGARADRPSALAAPAVAAAGESSTGTIEMSGHFIARNSARVTTTVMGRIARIAIHEGQGVRAGDPLVTLDATAAAADRAGLEAKLREQSLETHGQTLGLAQAERELQQQASLHADGFVSAVAVDRAGLAVEQARMRRDMAAAREAQVLGSLHSARDIEHQYVIRAPFDGQVVSIVATVGEVVAPGGYDTRYAQTGLLTIVDRSSLRVELAVQESIFHRLSAMGCASVHAVAQGADAAQDAIYEVERSSGQADRQRGTVTVYLKPSHPHVAWPVLDGEAVVRLLDRRDARCAPAPSLPKEQP